ncbi:BspA family leucine-rich repeat surface protein [Marinoscillum furvescens]|uniref:Surface protein n=1 Tax=Marinoscillum furvescens DSM 4134 TaxID=1122208 RepID=A0A3D9L6Z6_MARFU|nr:BspA family leucine-rich repeat surface protein [Marinoscillum furvescens]REE01070.1 surface protein [Marinoscillum furvescens DSM 4134]
MKKLLPLILSCVLTGSLYAQRAFITTWQTTTENESITIPTRGSGYAYTVDWGDGSTDTTTYQGSAIHVYTDPGIYSVSIIGVFPRIYFNNGRDKDKILTIEQWGDIQWTNMNRAFKGCSNLTIPATDAPNLSAVYDMYDMFFGATSMNADIGHWDVSNVRVMRGVFLLASSFNQDISSWDVSNVNFMEYMFDKATSFNQDISGWDVSKVTSMKGMFQLSSAFDQDLGAWNIEKVENMSLMFNESGMSGYSYDQTLQGWAEKAVQNNVTVGVKDMLYCFGESARESLKSNAGWSFDGDQKQCTSILQFQLDEAVSEPVINQSNQTVYCEVDFDTSLVDLVPELSVTEGASLSPQSGVALDFTTPQVYTVTSEDGTTTQDWTVTITYPSESATAISSFALPGQLAEAVIDTGAHTIEAIMPVEVDLTSIAPSITTSYGATVSPDSGMVNDFANPTIYTVTAYDGITRQDWEVSVVQPPVIAHVADQSVLGYSEFAITIEATDADGDDLVFSLDDTSKSKGMLIDENQVLRWTPTFIHQGSHAVEVVVMEETEHELTDTLRFTVDVEEMKVWDGNAWSTVSYNRVHVIASAYDTDAHGALEVGKDLIVEASGSLHIDAGSPVAVFSADVYNYGEVRIAPGGELIPLGGTLYGDNYTVERNTTFDQSTGRYSMIGSPVKDASFDVLGENALVYFYDESETYDPGGTDGLNRFKDPLANGMSEMEAGAGYFSAFTGDEDGLVTFVGTPHNSEITRSLTATDHAAVEDVYEGYHILSNPYPMSLSISEFLSENEDLEGAVYVWDDNGSDTGRGTNADYLVHNGDVAVQTTPGGRSSELEGLSSGQGFFVKMKEGVRETEVVLSPEMFGDGDNGTFFRQTPQAIARVNLTSANGFFRQTVVGLQEGHGLKNSFNAPVFDPASANLLYTICEGKALAIQGVNQAVERIPLGVNVSESGSYTLSSELEGSRGQALYLHDLHTGVYHHLND